MDSLRHSGPSPSHPPPGSAPPDSTVKHPRSGMGNGNTGEWEWDMEWDMETRVNGNETRNGKWKYGTKQHGIGQTQNGDIVSGHMYRYHTLFTNYM